MNISGWVLMYTIIIKTKGTIESASNSKLQARRKYLRKTLVFM